MALNMHNQYYEGILQLRNPNKEVLAFVRRQISKKPNVFIAKEVKQKNGIDLYLSSQHFMQSLGKKLKKSFVGELKISKKLYTRHHLTSKLVYRVNVLFKLLPYRRGEVINYRGEKIKIVSTSKKIIGKNIKTGKRVFIN